MKVFSFAITLDDARCSHARDSGFSNTLTTVP